MGMNFCTQPALTLAAWPNMGWKKKKKKSKWIYNGPLLNKHNDELPWKKQTKKQWLCALTADKCFFLSKCGSSTKMQFVKNTPVTAWPWITLSRKYRPIGGAVFQLHTVRNLWNQKAAEKARTDSFKSIATRGVRKMAPLSSIHNLHSFLPSPE